MKHDSNHPTRKEFIASILDEAISDAEVAKNKGYAIDWAFHIKCLREFRHQFVDVKLGQPEGTTRRTRQEPSFKIFRAKNPTSSSYGAYLSCCEAADIPEENRLTEAGFRERLRREKRAKKTGV